MHIAHHVLREDLAPVLTLVDYFIVIVAPELVLELLTALHDDLLHTIC